jgi:hypothetical protein
VPFPSLPCVAVEVAGSVSVAATLAFVDDDVPCLEARTPAGEDDDVEAVRKGVAKAAVVRRPSAKQGRIVLEMDVIGEMGHENGCPNMASGQTDGRVRVACDQSRQCEPGLTKSVKARERKSWASGVIGCYDFENVILSCDIDTLLMVKGSKFNRSSCALHLVPITPFTF